MKNFNLIDFNLIEEMEKYDMFLSISLNKDLRFYLKTEPITKIGLTKFNLQTIKYILEDYYNENSSIDEKEECLIQILEIILNKIEMKYEKRRISNTM